VRKTQLGPCEPGGTCEFLLELVNNGPDYWSGVPTITDILPIEGAQLQSWSPASWRCSLDQMAVTCAYPEATIPPGAAIGVTLALLMPEEIEDGMENCVEIGDGITPPVDTYAENDRVCVPIGVEAPPETFKPKPPPIIRPPVVTCPSGTHYADGICVKNVVTCPAGTHFASGICVKNVIYCPPGTHPVGRLCVKNVIVCPFGTYLEHGKCVRSQATCPSGYHLQNGKCVPNKPVCKSGYHLQNGKCVPNKPTCKSGYHLQNGKCVPNKPVCKKGYHLQNGKCVPNKPVCKKGYHLQNGKCVPNKPVCKKGYHLQNGKCVPNKTAGCPAGTKRVGKLCVRIKGSGHSG
jgi:hypothetical protein